MKKLHCFVMIMSISGFLAAASAEGKNNALVPLASVDDFSSGKDGWSFGSLALALNMKQPTKVRTNLAWQLNMPVACNGATVTTFTSLPVKR